MSRYQRAKRFVYLRGLATALLLLTAFILALGIADRITHG